MINEQNRSRKFYTYEPDANAFAGVGFMDDSSEILDLHWKDSLVGGSWQVLECVGFEDNPQEVGDFPSVSNYNRVPMMSSRAWDALRPIIGNVCELLPVKHPFHGDYFLVHVLKTVDALDEQASEIERRSPNDARIRQVSRYAFKYDMIGECHLFKLPNKSGSELIVDGFFKQTVEQHNLKGLIFKELDLAQSI